MLRSATRRYSRKRAIVIISFKEKERQTNLLDALRNRLAAAADAAGRSEFDVQATIIRIFAALDERKPDLSRLEREARRQNEIRKWKLSADPVMHRDFAARLVRMVVLKLGIGHPGHSETDAITKSAGITYDQVKVFEKRATDIVVGKGRLARNNKIDVASRIAQVVRDEWMKPIPYSRDPEPCGLTAKMIVETALPFIQGLAGSKLLGHSQRSEDPREMEPPGFGALMAIVRMTHPRTSIEYLAQLVRECYK